MIWLWGAEYDRIFGEVESFRFSHYWAVSGNNYLGPGLAVSGNKYLRLAVSG